MVVASSQGGPGAPVLLVDRRQLLGEVRHFVTWLARDVVLQLVLQAGHLAGQVIPLLTQGLGVLMAFLSLLPAGMQDAHGGGASPDAGGQSSMAEVQGGVAGEVQGVGDVGEGGCVDRCTLCGRSGGILAGAMGRWQGHWLHVALCYFFHCLDCLAQDLSRVQGHAGDVQERQRGRRQVDETNLSLSLVHLVLAGVDHHGGRLAIGGALENKHTNVFTQCLGVCSWLFSFNIVLENSYQDFVMGMKGNQEGQEAKEAMLSC